VSSSSRPRAAFLAAGLALLTLVLAGCSALYPPDPATEQARDIRGLYDLLFAVMAVIFVFVEGLIVWSVIRYRRRSDALPPQTHGNNVLEILWTLIPTVIVVATFVLSWGALNKVDAKSANPDVTIDVTGFQWQWTFEYKDYGLSYTGIGDQGPVMWMPVGETVHIRLHSNDVIHSFYVADFLFKRDVIPGQVNNFDVKVDREGAFTGQCAQLCGLGHNEMVFSVNAVTPDQFRAWVQQEQAKAQQTTAPPPGGQPSGSTLKLSAHTTTSFDQSSLEAPADTPVTIQLDNQTPGAPHNVAIKDPSGAVIFTGLPLAQSGQTASYSVPAMKAGTYTFFCSVHPNMTGTLTVK
jgi:cytochrome c oxidase subunit 2